MAKKSKEKPIIYVKNPIVGNIYWFQFAGQWLQGTLLCVNEKLTETYGVKWYTFEKMETYSYEKRIYKYPVSCFDIRQDKKDI